ncbi:MAG: methionyl-tRNA formyltransferase [Clostridiales bacterium]|jgi:methionyl-tRNA formyltransferase|nr:methionyl-tRNA formyltransferase [Clostridiales bacterium]
MKIAFLGTPDFAIPSLQLLCDCGHEITVFTQPDKPVGRRAILTQPPVKEFAVSHGLQVFQPRRIRDGEGQSALVSCAPDLMVTAAFGQILSAKNLAVPRYGCMNVHGSLLPAYRGAAPIQWAIIGGETTTGVTIMMTDVGLDTGDILLKREMAIGPDETAGELSERMAQLGADALKETVAALLGGTLTRIPQDSAAATRCGMLKKEHGKLNFHESAQMVHNRVRGVNPWPGAYALQDADIVKIWRTKLTGNPYMGEPGDCIGSGREGLFVVCGDGLLLEIVELQAPGGKRMDAKAYLRGRPIGGRFL